MYKQLHSFKLDIEVLITDILSSFLITTLSRRNILIYLSETLKLKGLKVFLASSAYDPTNNFWIEVNLKSFLTIHHQDHNARKT
jgi:hypothetical protein